MKFRQKFVRFMYGRYGNDKLGNFLLLMSVTLMVVNSFLNFLSIYLLEIVFFSYYIFRCFSRNIAQRYKENQIFDTLLKKIIAFFKLQKAKWRDRKTHIYTKCPHCKANIRLPRKAGNHRVNCPKCHMIFGFKCRK